MVPLDDDWAHEVKKLLATPKLGLSASRNRSSSLVILPASKSQSHSVLWEITSAKMFFSLYDCVMSAMTLIVPAASMRLRLPTSATE